MGKPVPVQVAIGHIKALPLSPAAYICGAFIVQQYRIGQYILKDSRRSDHARFGSLTEILEDIDYVFLNDKLPMGEKW